MIAFDNTIAITDFASTVKADILLPDLCLHISQVDSSLTWWYNSVYLTTDIHPCLHRNTRTISE